ncbi:MAG: CPBP family intramembrane metalloprotease [Oscillospiraceae bacterium]|nr:CPBP family intramembrane metalloprotease [Oscillospiraceae bacterium]
MNNNYKKNETPDDKDSPGAQITAHSYKLGGLVCLCMVLKYLAAFFASLADLNSNVGFILQFILSGIVANGVLAFAVYKVFEYRGVFQDEDFSFNTPLLNLSLLLGAGYFCVFVSNAMSRFLVPVRYDITGLNGVVDVTVLSGFKFFVFCLFTVIIIPVVEEFIFRRMVLQQLRKFGDCFAIMVTALLFAVARGDTSELLYCFVVGVMLGYLVIWTNSIIPSMVAHVLISVLNILDIQAFSFPPEESGVTLLQTFLLILMVMGFFAALYLIFIKSFNTKNNCDDITTINKVSSILVNPVIVFAIMLNILLYNAI